LASGGIREPCREEPDFPETERNWPFAAEDSSGMLNDRLRPRNKANMPSRLPSADNASGFGVFISFRGPDGKKLDHRVSSCLRVAVSSGLCMHCVHPGLIGTLDIAFIFCYFKNKKRKKYE
jgi:hypothetical protein